MAKKGRRATDEERVRVVQLLEDGYSTEAVADMLGVARARPLPVRPRRPGASVVIVLASAVSFAS
ncbi:MAG: helix-turn-helix domain-containing protein [Actinobacteria bacterium]|nr:helix-turn-helix domain-containing protein [Actinomycetota bacterium]